MTRIPWEKHVVIEPDLHHGVPCIRGTRIPVTVILGSLADGMDASDILKSYPQLTQEDIQAALSYATEVVRSETLAPLP